MEKLKIEKGIALIPVNYNNHPKTENPYPFENMEKGDSFFVKCNTDKNWNGYNIYYNRIYTAMYNFRKEKNKSLPYNQGINFTIRAVSGGFRCWRIK